MPIICHCKTKNTPNFITFDDATLASLNELVDINEHQITGNLDMFAKVNEVLGLTSQDILNITNVWYDDKILIQSFTPDSDPSNEVIVKRKIGVNDSYTFLEYDKYEYEYIDLTKDELLNVLKSRHIHNGVFIGFDDTKNNIKYIIDNDELFGKFTVKQNETNEIIHYINMQAVMAQLKDNEDIDAKMTQLMSEKQNVTHILSQHHFGMGILICVSPLFGFVINKKIGKLLNCEVWGDCYLGLSDLNNDISNIIDLNLDLFDKLISYRNANPTLNLQEYKSHNEAFCNIYNEVNFNN